MDCGELLVRLGGEPITFEPARASDIERRIHHTAHVENFTPRRGSDLSTARTNPTVPS